MSVSAYLDVKTIHLGKKIGGGGGGGVWRAPIHTPDEIHHGECCIHVTLDNKVILFLLKMHFNSFICKVKKCPVRNALSMSCPQRTVNYPPRSFLNIF